MFFLKKDDRRQLQWQTMLKKDNLDIQQLTLGPITNNNSEIVSNPDLIDDEFFTKFLVIINDAILVTYSENERAPKKLNVLNTNQRIFKSFF